MKKSEFGIIGLGVMGGNLALNVLDNEISLSVYNRNVGLEAEVVNDFLAKNSTYKNLEGYTDLKNFIESLERPRKILIMIKAGAAIDSVINELLPFLEKGDILIDGGNSYYLDTERRIEELDGKGIHFIGCGISGGAEGARNGPSMMAGGPKEGYNSVSDILKKISAKDKNGAPCCSYIGPGGAGHYIKMIHNGIEYAEMQLIAEIYSFLKMDFSNAQMNQLFEKWNSSDLKSYLLGISAKILGTKEKGEYVLDTILDRSGNKGTGFWSVRSGLELGLPATMMSSSLYARFISAFKDERIKLSNKIGSTVKKKQSIDTEQIEKSYRFARIINHHQGFEILEEASSAHNWNLNLSEIARIWTNGCIIRSELMEKLSSIFKDQIHILEEDDFLDFLKFNENQISSFIQSGMQNRISLDCFWSAYNYWVGKSTERSAANLIQAQRDFFGGHTYQRIDRPTDEFFHFNWDN